MAPPVTPSPHRFLAKPQHKTLNKDETPQSQPNPKPKPDLRHDAFRTPASKLQHKPLPTPTIEPTRQAPKFSHAPAANTTATPTTKTPKFEHEFKTPAPKSNVQVPQFAATPRFSFAQAQAQAQTHSAKRPRLREPDAFYAEQESQQPAFATPRRFAPQHLEETLIEDNGPNSSPTRFGIDNASQSGREVDEHESFLISRHSFLNRDPAPISHVPDEEDAVEIDPDTEPEILSPHSPLRPVFLQPASPARIDKRPLPEAFSPHRRGQKFLPGGMAEEVRGWVLGVGTGSGSGSGVLASGSMSNVVMRGGDKRWRVEVMEASGGSNGVMTFVHGRFEDKSEVRLCLPSAEGGRGAVGVQEWGVISFRGVTWSIELEGRSWVVAPEWSVEKGTESG